MPETARGTQGRAQDPRTVALSIAGQMRAFGSGEMAALRRLDEGVAVPAYWRLAARHDALHARREAWTPIVRALAVLTPKGPPGALGGGTLAPGASPRPLVSEARLAQLMAARGRQRAVLLTRAVRALAASRDVGIGLDVGDLAWCFLTPDAGRLAAPYYARLDRVARSAGTNETERTRDA